MHAYFDIYIQGSITTPQNPFSEEEDEPEEEDADEDEEVVRSDWLKT